MVDKATRIATNTFSFTRMLAHKGVYHAKELYNKRVIPVKREMEVPGERENDGIADYMKAKWKQAVHLTINPNLIIDDIYLGNAYNASNFAMTEEYEITAVVNVTKSIPNFFQGTYKYLHIPIDDRNGESIVGYVDEFIKFVDAQRKLGSKILLHCYMGASRSVSLMVAYLIKKHNMTLRKALLYVKKKRPGTNINQTFIDELRKLDTSMDSNEVMTKNEFESLLEGSTTDEESSSSSDSDD